MSWIDDSLRVRAVRRLQDYVNRNVRSIPNVYLWRNSGLCGLLDPHRVVLPDDYVALWPKFSGRRQCPVPSPFADKGPGYAFMYLDKWEGVYGESRRELFNFLCDQTPWLQEMEEGRRKWTGSSY